MSAIAGRFRRPEPRRRALTYLRGLLSPVERKNGWQLAEQAGDATPDGVQRLLYNYRWEADLVRDDLRDYVVEHLGEADGVVVVDETGFLKKGDKSVGVQRQYSGTAGRIENCQVGVFLAYASAKGQDATGPGGVPAPGMVGRLVNVAGRPGAPEDVCFRTKPQLAQLMLRRALESGVPFAWFTGDEVYGSDRKLRLWLEREEIPHVMAIKSNEKLWAWTDKGPLQERADRLASGVEESAWVRCSAGNGAKGPTGLRLGCRGNTAPAGAGQGPLAAGPSQPCQAWGVGLLRVLRPGGDSLGGAGQGGRNPVGHRRMLRRGQGRGGTGPVRGTAVGWLVPAHHSGDVGPSLSDGNQASGDGTGRKGGHFGPDEELDSCDGPGGAPAAHPLGMDGKPTA